jgi:thioredoxin-like negative regulator of GroEL
MKKIFYFTSLGCIPCQTLGPVMDQISQHISVEKITVDYELNRARQANVSSVPTVILTENGQEIRRFTGVRSFQDVLNFIKSV